MSDSPDVADDGDVTRHLRVVSGHSTEKHTGDVVPDDRLDLSAESDLAGDAAEESEGVTDMLAGDELPDLHRDPPEDGVIVCW